MTELDVKSVTERSSLSENPSLSIEVTVSSCNASDIPEEEFEEIKKTLLVNLEKTIDRIVKHELRRCKLDNCRE